MYLNFKPINDNVLVQMKETETKTSSGIIIPTDAREKNQTATVIHAGKSTQLVAGDSVYYKKYVGTALDESYLVLKEEDILGVL